MKERFISCLFVLLLLLVGCTTTHSVDEQKNITHIEKYQVFKDYELYHSNYLSEGLSFYKSHNPSYVLGYGHQAHAMSVYRLFLVDEEKQTVSIIRMMNEDFNGEAISHLLSLENWEEEMIHYMLENIELTEEMFFFYDENIGEVEVVIEGKTHSLYPVPVDDNIYYFKKDEGLWAKYYAGESTITFYGEPQLAYRKELE